MTTQPRKCRFIVFEDKAGEWRWRLRDTNNAIVASSAESYVSEANAVRGATNAKACATAAIIVKAAARAR